MNSKQVNNGGRKSSVDAITPG